MDSALIYTHVPLDILMLYSDVTLYIEVIYTHVTLDAIFIYTHVSQDILLLPIDGLQWSRVTVYTLLLLYSLIVQSRDTV